MIIHVNQYWPRSTIVPLLLGGSYHIRPYRKILDKYYFRLLAEKPVIHIIMAYSPLNMQDPLIIHIIIYSGPNGGNPDSEQPTYMKYVGYLAQSHEHVVNYKYEWFGAGPVTKFWCIMYHS